MTMSIKRVNDSHYDIIKMHESTPLKSQLIARETFGVSSGLRCIQRH